ncbi:MAG: hypothetical protein K9I74_11015 [Bacteroidales bacterium]|nr:hypothetical protein [Bacteroidales bacterium]
MEIAIFAAFFWAGCVSSISFMEAWVKFRAKGVTKPIGLSIGKKVFSNLNKVEWGVWLLFSVFYILNIPFKLTGSLTMYTLITIILILQSAYFYPQLSFRANKIIEGQQPPKSAIHLINAILEGAKVGMIIVTGFLLLYNL